MELPEIEKAKNMDLEQEKTPKSAESLTKDKRKFWGKNETNARSD